MQQLDVLTSQIGFTTDGNQYLTFSLGDEEYGLDILKVQEIKGYSAVTPNLADATCFTRLSIRSPLGSG